MGIWSRMSERAACVASKASVRLHGLARDEEGQGTTEYAILVGVLVVLAIVAIMLFKPKLEELWNAIATNINSL